MAAVVDRVPDILRLEPLRLIVTAGLGHGNFAPPVSVDIPDWTLDDQQIQQAKIQDVNGDGLADLVIERVTPGTLWYWLNLGNYTLSTRKVITGLPNVSGDVAVRWADLNGNGTTDLVYASGELDPKILTVDLGNLMGCAPGPNLLVFIDNGIGRKTTIEYAPSTLFALTDAEAGNPWPDAMPFPVSVVSAVKTDDSLGNLYITKFVYHDGYYDPEEKEFRGFARAEQIDIGDESAPTLASQSHFNTGRNVESLKGKLMRIITAQATDETFSEETSTWFSEEITNWGTRTLMTGTDGKAVIYAFPTSKRTHILELGQGTPVLLESEFVYDDYGNQTMNKDFGIVVDAGDGQTLRSAPTDDERITETEFALNLEDWLVRSPMWQEIKDENDVVISRTEYFYDDETFSGNNLGVVTKGNLTLQREWINPANPGAFVESSRTKYDAYGNPILLLDPLANATARGHYREIVYDERFHSYPESEIIHLGDGKEPLVIRAGYDLGFGTVIFSFDFNSQKTTYGYDTFARLINTVRPGDTSDYPTIEYDYILAEPFGEEGVINYVETRMLDCTPGTAGAKLNHYFISRQFVDGLSREVMTKGEAEPDPVTGKPRVAVSNATLFNARQKPASVLQPFYTQIQGVTLDELLAFEDINASGWTGQFHEDGVLISLDLSTAHKTSSMYDATLRPLATINPDGTESRMVYEPLIEKSFDENDTDPASPHFNTPFVHHKDGLGRLIQTDEIVRINDNGSPSGDIRTWTTRCEYDLNDNLTRITDSLGNIKSMKYDGLKRKTFMDDPDRGRMTYEYDAASNLILQIDNPGEESEQHIVYEYDGANRILTEDYLDEKRPEVSLGRSSDVEYYYDTASTVYPDASNTRGLPAYIVDLAGAEYLSYDARGNLKWKVRQIDGTVGYGDADPTEGAREFRIAYEYDSLDRIIATTYPDDTRIEQLYNERNLLESIPGYLVSTEYQPSGQLQKEHLANSVITDYSYDSRMRMTNLRTQSDAGLLQDYRYRFDGPSNILEIIDAIEPDDSPGNAEQLFQYDSLYRLIKAQSPAYGTLQYRYNPIGNLIYKSADSGDPRVDLGNFTYGTRININGAGPHAVTGVSGGAHGYLAITYDANGNYRTYGETTYDFDYLDRLFRVNVPEKEGKPGSISEYRYDYTSQRMVKLVTKEGNTEETLYPFPEFEIRNDKAVKYIFAGDRRLARVEESVESEYRRQLPDGWNLLALPVEPEKPSVHEVLSSLGTTWSAAAIYDATAQQFIIAQNGDAESEQFEIHADAGFWLYLDEPAELWVVGAIPENAGGAVEDLSPQLKAGWNLVGGAILGGTSIDQIEQTLGNNFSIWDYVNTTGEWKSYRKDVPEFLNTLTGISADRGYWIHVDTPVDLPASEIKVSRVFFYHPDHLGSSNVITDMNGEIVEKSQFYPYGQVRYRSADSSFDTAYKFTGKELDVESGL
ncbi:VCBS repeat-containing protein [bacterium]|nr:VCBS repeat-containing protein [bacterium]